MQLFDILAMIFVIGGIASALVIAAHESVCPQPMRIMNSVWILTGLWASFFGLWAYFAFGRRRGCAARPRGDREDLQTVPAGTVSHPDVRNSDRAADPAGAAASVAGERMSGSAGMPGAEGMTGMDMPDGSVSSVAGENDGTDRSDAPMPAIASGKEGMDMPDRSVSSVGGGMAGMNMPDRSMPSVGGEMAGMSMAGMRMPRQPRWQSVVLSTLHCGAGCTLADLLGEWFLYFVPIAIGGSLVAGTWVVDYVLALVFGIGFQYAAIRAMQRALPRTEAVRRAAKADILSLTAWQAGMYGWMSIVLFVLRDGAMLPRTSFAFWWMMQVAMACGFLLSLPVNVLLIKRGIKEGM